jgi:hypothetical protein
LRLIAVAQLNLPQGVILPRQYMVLGQDDHPNVGNLIGYSYRKLSNSKFSQVWYERALKADPNQCL